MTHSMYPLEIDDNLVEKIADDLQAYHGADYDSRTEFLETMMGETFETQNALVSKILKSDKQSRKWDLNRSAFTKPEIIGILGKYKF